MQPAAKRTVPHLLWEARVSRKSDDDLAGAIALGAIFLVLLIAGFLVRTQAPCEWLGWMPAGDLPGRCLMRS